jgi:hypothetical protein
VPSGVIIADYSDMEKSRSFSGVAIGMKLHRDANSPPDALSCIYSNQMN